MIPADHLLAAFGTAPFADLAALTGDAPLLVLAPHPDDESLGCGGLIAEAAARGQSVHVAILTDGTGSHPNSRSHPPARLKSLREAETRAAAAALGLPDRCLTFLARKDSSAPTDAETAQEVAALARAMRAGTILTTWRHDPHCDHEAAYVLAARAAAMAHLRLLATPIWGWTLPPTHALPPPAPRALRLDITHHLPAKRAAIAAHASQHGRVIADDPAAFTLAPAFLALFDRPWEVLLAA